MRRQQLAGTWRVVQLAVEDQLRLLVQLLFNTLIDSEAKEAEQYILSLFKDLLLLFCPWACGGQLQNMV